MICKFTGKYDACVELNFTINSKETIAITKPISDFIDEKIKKIVTESLIGNFRYSKIDDYEQGYAKNGVSHFSIFYKNESYSIVYNLLYKDIPIEGECEYDPTNPEIVHPIFSLNDKGYIEDIDTGKLSKSLENLSFIGKGIDLDSIVTKHVAVKFTFDDIKY